MMANELVSINQLDAAGVILDAPPSGLAPNAFSDARNVRFRDSAASKMTGEVILNAIPDQDSVLVTEYAAFGTTFGPARYLAYWPNPNLGELSAYYIFIMAVYNSNGVHIADRVYLQDEEGNFKDVTPPTLVNDDGYKGFSPRGSWHHTSFTGGFAIIINNGIDRPHYILDTINNTVLNDVPVFAELPGWDSYNIDIEAINIIYDTHQGVTFNLGQKVDFANYYIEVDVNGTSYSVVTGTPSGSGTPNGTDFVPGTLPTSGISMSSNQFEIYNDAASDTTVVAIDSLVQDDPLSIKIISRNVVQVRAGVLRSFGNLLVAGDLVEIDSVSGDVIRRLSGVVRTSDIAVTGAIPNNWNPFAAGASTADEFTLSDTNVIQEMKSIQGSLYIYTNSSIHSMSLTNNPLLPVRFTQVTESYGCITTGAVVEYDGKHLVVGSNDIYAFPGHPANIQSVAANRVRNYFYKNLNPLHETKLFTLLNKAQDEIWICYPTLNSITGECDEALIWNYRQNNWTKRDLNEVIAGDMSPIRGGGIPLTTIDLTSGSSGNDIAINTGRQEVQTMTISGKMMADHDGVKQQQEFDIPTFTAFSTESPEEMEYTFIGDTGPNITYAKSRIYFGQAGRVIASSDAGNVNDVVFTRNAAVGGGLVIEFTLQNGGGASNVPIRINGSDVYNTNDGVTRTVDTFLTDLASYINDLDGSHALGDVTASRVIYGQDSNGDDIHLLEITSNVPGQRSITNVTADVYTGTTVGTSGNGTDQEVDVSFTQTAATTLGYLWPTQATYKATSTTTPGTGDPNLSIPFFDEDYTWNNFGSTATSDSSGHETVRDAISELQMFIGGWTTAGAGGSYPSNFTTTYTVARTGDLYFILTGAGGGGADHNYGGGAGGAAGGTIAAQAGDTIDVTAGASGPRDSYGGAGYSGRASKIVWKRNNVILATIEAKGGGGADNGSVGYGGSATPSSAPSGITNYWTYRGENSTGSVNPGEGNRGGSRNGGRGVFAWYQNTTGLTRTLTLDPITTNNTGLDGRTYAGRWSPGSLNWKPEYGGFGDGTQAHSDSPSCCTWNAIPPGAVWLWQDGVTTDYTITNNRTIGNHFLQQDLYNLTLNAVPDQTVNYLATGSSTTVSILGAYSDLSWTAEVLGTQYSSFSLSGGSSGYFPNAGGTGIDVTYSYHPQQQPPGSLTFTNNGNAPATISSINVGGNTFNFSDADFQIGETHGPWGSSLSGWTINGTYLTNTGGDTALGTDEYTSTQGNGVYGISANDSPSITIRFAQTASSYVPNGFTIDVTLPANETSSEDISLNLVAALKQITEFSGLDPRIPNQTQPTGAYYYVEANADSLLRVGSNAVNIFSISNEDIDASLLVVSAITKTASTEYLSTQFGGQMQITQIVNIDGSTATGTRAPTIRMLYDNTYLDFVLFGQNWTQELLAEKVAQVLDNTPTFRGQYSNTSPYTVTATREIGEANTNLITIGVISDPDNVMPATLAGQFTETVAGVDPSAGQGTMTLTLPASEFLPAQNVTVRVAGNYNNQTSTGVELNSSQIGDLIRSTNISGWVIGGYGADVTFTTADNWSVNRLDDGAGTGTVQNFLWEMTADDDGGLFAVPSDPLQDTTAVETTSGIPVRYSQPTVFRILYSDNTFQDYVFGGGYNGALAISTPYNANLYSGGQSTTTYTNVEMVDKLESGIKAIGGRTLNVERTGNSLRISPIQYSTTGLYIQSATLTYGGTLAPQSLTVPIQTEVLSTLGSTISSFGRFDPDRPWANDQVKSGSIYPIFIQTSNANTSDSKIVAADIGYKFNADPTNNIAGDEYISFVERRELGISPHLDTEQIVTTALQATGGTATELNGPLYYPTLHMRVSPTNYTGDKANLLATASLTNDYTITQDYKIDTKITGRFLNYRIDDADQDPTVAATSYAWSLSSLQMEINKGGSR